MINSSGRVERGIIRNLIDKGVGALEITDRARSKGIMHQRRKAKISLGSSNHNSVVEEAVLKREAVSLLSEPSQVPDPRLKVLRNAIEDPQIQQAMTLQLGLKDGKPKSRAEIAQEMKIPEANVDVLIKRGVEILRGSKETPTES